MARRPKLSTPKQSTSGITGAAVTLILAQISTLIILALGVAAALSLRPVSDDYCVGTAGAQGLVGGTLQNWQNWSGDLFSQSLLILSVGVPLANFPLSIASSAPFLLTGSLIAVSVMMVSTVALKGGRRTTWWLGLLIPFFLLLWWSYLWLTADPSSGASSVITLGLTHWQTVNGAYLIPASILLILLVAMIRMIPRLTRTAQLAAVVVGVLFGMSGPVLGLTLFIAAAATLLFAVIWRSTLPKRFVSTVILLGAGALAGLIIAMTSPGARIRREYVNPSTEVSPRRLLEILDFVFPAALTQWGDAYLHWGALLVLLATGATAWLAVKVGFNWSIPVLSQMVVVAVASTLMLSIANRISEAFVYEAYWHQSVIRFSAFVSLVLAGVLLGQYLGLKESKILPPTIVAVLAVCLLASLGAVLAMTNSIYEREKEWSVGPAPIPGVAEDIGNPEVWVNDCWLRLKEIRDMPARG